MTVSDKHTCTSCGGPLPEIRDVPRVICGYCKLEQSNPLQFWVGQELIVRGFHGMTLAQVSAVVPGKEIRVRIPTDATPEKVFAPADVIQVTADRATVVPGQRIYFRSALSWDAGYVMRADPSEPTVVVAKEGWEAPIFHQRIMPDALRVVLPLRIAPGTKTAAMASRFSFGQQLAIIVILAIMLPLMLGMCALAASVAF